MRTTYIVDKNGRLVQKGYKKTLKSGPCLIKDIDPYKAITNGEYIGSRRQHREYLKRNGLIEVGNESNFINKRNQMLEKERNSSPIDRIEIDFTRGLE